MVNAIAALLPPPQAPSPHQRLRPAGPAACSSHGSHHGRRLLPPPRRGKKKKARNAGEYERTASSSIEKKKSDGAPARVCVRHRHAPRPPRKPPKPPPPPPPPRLVRYHHRQPRRPTMAYDGIRRWIRSTPTPPRPRGQPPRWARPALVPAAALPTGSSCRCGCCAMAHATLCPSGSAAHRKTTWWRRAWPSR